ncbi:MAG: histidine phosphatase family protein [Candidatus Spechtbacterales bacterium]|nr:histidine phosphatase family protein [Candidatus Spechtbacterales bacterium]
MLVPSKLTAIRHGESVLNEQQFRRKQDHDYHRLLESFETDPHSEETQALARIVVEKYGHQIGDHAAPLTQRGQEQARLTGEALKAESDELPDVIYLSPYLRCQETFRYMTLGWPELLDVEDIFNRDNALAETDYGAVFPYGDWTSFFALHPDERRRHELAGPYWYRYPNGENVPDLQQRLSVWYDRMVANFANRHVMVIAHYGTILGLRSNIEGWAEDEFIEAFKTAPGANCGVTEYRASSTTTSERKLLLQRFAAHLYPDTLLPG